MEFNLIGERVWVYRNLRRGGYSVRLRGKVVCHCDQIDLDAVQFRIWKGVQAAARQKEQRNVHAFIIGTVVSAVSNHCDIPLMYNYKRNNTFVSAYDGLPLLDGGSAQLRSEGVFVSREEPKW